MTLRDLIDALDPEEKVYIGADNGAGFIAVSKIKDIDLDGVDALRLKELQQSVKRFTGLSDNKIKMAHKYTDDMEKNGKTPRLETMLASAIEYGRKYAEVRDRLLERVAAYKPLAGRVVVETYPKLLEPATVIIVHGHEEGFWFEEEFNKWQRRWR